MRQETSLFNKALAFVLCMFVMLSSINLSAITYAAEEATDYRTVSEAELVADNYESLSSGEKALLKSGYLASRTLTYPVPSGSEGLVSVNPGTRKITAAPYEKDGYVWNPVYASVVHGEEKDLVKLTDGEGTFSYEGAAYTIEVIYELHIAVDQATQEKLLNDPYLVARLLENGEELSRYESDFGAISNNVDALVSLTDGSLPYGTRITTETTVNAINDMAAQAEANDGFLDIENMLIDYGYAESKLAYLIEHGSELKAEAAKIYEQIGYIYNDQGIATILELLSDGNSTKKKVRVVLRSLNTLLSNLEPTVEDDWAMLTSNPLKDDLSAEDYVSLDALAEAANASLHEEELKEKLLADSTTISVNVNQHTVTVVVSAAVIKRSSVDNATPVALENHTAEIRLADGMSAEDVLAAIAASGLEQNALNAWGEISEDNYDRAEDEIAGELVSDITFRIRYTPKAYDISYGFETALPASVPYGYNLTLPLHEGNELVYDYKVNGESYLQGEIVRITGATEITRTEGKPWNVQTVAKLVALSYSDQLTPEEAAVLNAVALRSDYILLRTPSNDDELVSISIVNEDGGDSVNATTKKYMVAAQNYASGLAGLSWQAVSGKAIDGTGAVKAEFTFNSGLATFTSESFEKVDVVYKLVLDGVVDDQKVLDTLNLPGILAEQAAEQKENMEILNGLYSKLGQLTRATLNQIKFGVGGSDMSEEAKAAVEAVLHGCVDDNEAKLYLYIYLTEYRKSGLTYYYQDNNYLRIRNQVEILNANLSTIYNDPEFLPLLQDIEYEEYYERIADIISDLSRVTLSDPHEAINTASPSLAELVSAIEQINEPRTFMQANEELVLTKTINAALGALVTVNVQAKNSAGEVIKSGEGTIVFALDEPLTDSDIASLNALIEEIVNTIKIDTVHYTTSGELGIAAGDTLKGSTTINVVYTPKEYTVKIIGEEGAQIGETTFKYDNPTIILPACEEEGKQYRYTVCGEQIIVGSEAKSVTFTAEQIDSNAYETVTRETVNIYRDGLLALVEQINIGVAEAGFLDGSNISFAIIPLEDENGNLLFVLRMSPKNPTKDKLSALIQNTADAITESDFTYITLGEDLLREDSLISLQAVINAVLNSGMSLDTILEVIKPDGTINEMTLEGATVIGADSNGKIHLSNGKGIPHTEKLGGKLMETTLNLGVSENDAGVNAKLYITIEDFGKSKNNLDNVRDLASRARSYGNVTAHDGMIDAEVTLPDRAYQAYITSMVALGNTTLHDLDKVDLIPLRELALEIAKFIFADETITTETFENTLDKVGVDKELSKFEKYYSKARKVLNHVVNNITIDPETEVATSNEYQGDVIYDLTALFDKMDLAETFRNKVKEKDSGVCVTVKGKLLNENDYDALVIDHSAKGSAKVVYTHDLAKALKSAHKNTAIILLKDYDGDVTIRKQGLLDLNGHTINGNLVCEARTLVIDSTLDTASEGGVTGTVSGNAIITAGEYGSDVSSMLKTGYAYEDGKVKNLYYYIEVVPGRGDEVINVHFTPDYEAMKAQNKNGLKAIFAQLSADIALNYYMCAALTVGGYDICEFAFDDVLRFIDGVTGADVNEMLDGINCAGVTDFANDLLAKLTDFSTSGEAILAGEAVASYDVTYLPWTFELEHVADGDYLTANAKPNADNEKTQTLNFFVDDNDGLGDTLVELGEILTIEAEVELEDIYYDSSKKDITFIGNFDLEATADLTGDPNYAIVIGTVLANGTEDDAKREALVEAIETYFRTGYLMADLKAAVEAMTTQELIDSFNTDTSFEDMVSALGLDGIVTEEAAELYNTYRRVIKITFRVIDRLFKFSGSSSKLGAFEEDYGVYSSEKTNKTVERGYEVRGDYGVTGIVTAETVKLTVKLFTEDVPFPIIVLDTEGNEIWHGSDLNEAFEQALDGYTIVVSDEVELTADVELDREVKLEGGEFVDFGEYVIILTDPDNSKFIIDVEAFDNVESGVEDYSVLEEQDDEQNYVYTLEEDQKYKIIVYSAEDEILYTGDDLNEAFEAATAGSTIYVLDEVELTANVELDRDVKLEGGEFVDFGEYTITLTDVENSKLTIDVQITDTVKSGSEYSVVDEDEDNGDYIYTLSPLAPVINNATIDKQDPTIAYKIDNERGIIILDVVDPASFEDLKLAGNGITNAQFKAQLGFTFENAETTEIAITFNGSALDDGKLVPTGTKVTVTATNPDYNGVVTKEYDVVILGDTNCNGRVDSGDAKLMLDHYMGISELTGLKFIAGDTNCNGRIESGDAVKNTIKYNRPKEYKSDLE